MCREEEKAEKKEERDLIPSILLSSLKHDVTKIKKFGTIIYFL